MIISELFDGQIEEINFSIKNIFVIKNKPGHQFSYCLDDHFRLLYCSRGSTKFIFSNLELQTLPGDVLYMPPRIKYTSKWDAIKGSVMFMLELSMLNNENMEINFGHEPKILFHDDYYIYEGFIKEIEGLTFDIPYGWLNRMSLALKILRNIAADTHSNEHGGESYWKIRQGIRYMEENYTSNFLISDIAKLCAMSEGHFRRLFINLTGTSPIAYRNKLRIQKSIELLKTGKFNVSEAGEAVGIYDVKYYSRLFQKITGIKPSQIMR